jgi:class 3 adenylate cyclase
MADERDWVPFVDAGLLATLEPADADRRELLNYLLEQGCSLEEMVDADLRGRLFGLAGDRIARPGARTFTLPEVAQQLGVDEDAVRRIWRALGLGGWEGSAAIASPVEVESVGLMTDIVAIAGEDLALELARSIGASLARIAETANVIGRLVSPDSTLDTSPSELATARYWAEIAPLVPALGTLVGAFFGHHVDQAQRAFERSDSFDVMHRRLTRLAVGFVDMTGFTTATEELDEVDFAALMSTFSTRVDETVQDHGGRVVKFVGDAAMIVAADPVALATITMALLTDGEDRTPSMALHAGLAHGELLSQDGDYFGSAVNLAARLAALADPGSILVSEVIGAALPPTAWEVEWFDPRPIRGFDEPVLTASIRERLPT